MIFASIWLILGVIRVKLESGNATRVRKLTQLTRVTRLDLQTLVYIQAGTNGSPTELLRSNETQCCVISCITPSPPAPPSLPT